MATPKNGPHHLESNEIQISVADLFLCNKEHISPIQDIPYFLLLAYVCPNFHWLPDLILDSAVLILGFNMFQHVSSQDFIYNFSISSSNIKHPLANLSHFSKKDGITHFPTNKRSTFQHAPDLQILQDSLITMIFGVGAAVAAFPPVMDFCVSKLGRKGAVVFGGLVFCLGAALQALVPWKRRQKLGRWLEMGGTWSMFWPISRL